MNTITNQSPSFMMKMAVSKNLNPAQASAAKFIGDRVNSINRYKFISDDIILCFLKPARDIQVLKASIFNKKMGTFFRDESNRILTVSAKALNEPTIDKCFKYAQDISNMLSDVVRGKYKAPDWAKNPAKYAEEERRVFGDNEFKIS